MERDKATHQHIEQTLNSLDGMHRAEAPPFFYTRLQARLDQYDTASASWTWIARPAFSFAIVILLLVLNITAISSFLKQGKTQVNQPHGIQAFAQEYDMGTSSVYNYKVSQ